MAESSITYDKKRYLVILVFILLFVVTYKKIYTSTFDKISNYHQLKNQNTDSLRINNELLIVKKEIEKLDVILGDETFNEATLQQDILSFISANKKSKKITIASLEKTHKYTSKDIEIITNSLTIQGNYNDLLEMIYTLEQDFKSSKVTSVKMFKKRNNAKKRNELYAQILFQNYRYF